MSFLFGGAPPTTAELARRYKLSIARAVRDLDRESAQIRLQEQQAMREIRHYADTNHALTMQKARAVVRARKMQARFSSMKGQLQEIGSRILQVRSSEALQTAMASANRAMQCFGARMGDRSMVKTLRDFAQSSARLGAQSDLAEETLDSIFDDEADGEDDAQQADDIIISVLQEAGVRLPSASGLPAAAAAPPVAVRMTTDARGPRGYGGEAVDDASVARRMVAVAAGMPSETFEQRLLRLRPAGQ